MYCLKHRYIKQSLDSIIRFEYNVYLSNNGYVVSNRMVLVNLETYPSTGNEIKSIINGIDPSMIYKIMKKLFIQF